MDSKSKMRRANNGHGRRTTNSRDASQSLSRTSFRAGSSPSMHDSDGHGETDQRDDAMDVDPQSETAAKSTSSAAPKPPVRTPSLSPPADGSSNASSHNSNTRSAASALAASLTPTAKALLDGFSKLASPKPCSSPRILPNCDPLPLSTVSALASLAAGPSTSVPGLSTSDPSFNPKEDVELDWATLPGDSLVHAAIEARLPITAMSDLEYRAFGKHFGSPPEKLAMYLDVRNRILRAFFLTPQRALTLHEAIRACRGHRLDLVGAVYQFLVRNSMINFGVVRPPGMTGGVLVSSSSEPVPAPLSRAADGQPARPRRFVIIGAGAAGLSCARQLKQISESVAFSATLDPASDTAQVTRTIPPPEIIVLEARNRVGGRVYTHPLYTKVRTSQSPFASTYTTGVDLGAKVVTGWDGGNPIKTIVRGQLRLNTHELNGPTRMFDSHGDEVDSSMDELVEEVFNELLEETTRMREEMKAANKKGVRSRGRGRNGRSRGSEMMDAGSASDYEGTGGSPMPSSNQQHRRRSIVTRSTSIGASSSGAVSSAASSRASSLRRASRKVAASASSSAGSSSINPSDHDSSGNVAASDQSDTIDDGRSSSNSSNDDEEDDNKRDQSDNETHSTRSRRSSSSTNRPARLFSLPELATMSLGDAIDKALKEHPQYQGFSDKETELLHWHFANLEFANSCTVDQSSLEHWDQDDEHELLGPHGMIIGGYGQVTHALAYGCRAMAVQTGTEADGIATDALDLRLNTPVTEIKWNKVHKSRLRSSSKHLDGNDNIDSIEPSNAEVVCADGTRISADAVIVTVPLGVLKSNSIQFSPQLPKRKQSSIQRLGFGTLNKVVLVFKSAFWDTGIESFGYANPSDPSNPGEYFTTRGRNYLFWNMTDVVKLPVLVAISAGQAAVRLESTPDTVIVQEALDALRKMYGSRNVPPPLETVVTRWSYDEYARGSYSYVATGASGDDYDRLAAPLGNTVYFAGEHTCREYPATVHGAMLSGMRAAADVANAVYGEVKYVEDATVMEVVEPSPEGALGVDTADGGGQAASGFGAGVMGGLFATLVNGMAGGSGEVTIGIEPMQVDPANAPVTKRKRGGNGAAAVTAAHNGDTRGGSSTYTTPLDLGAMEFTDDIESGDGAGAGSDGADHVGPKRFKRAKSSTPLSTKKPLGTKAASSSGPSASAPLDDSTEWRIKPGRSWTRTNITIPCTQYMSSDSPCAVTCSTPSSFFQHILTHLPPADRQRFPTEPDGSGEYPTLPRMYMPIPPKAPTKNPFMLFQLVSWEAMRRETPDNERHLIRQRMGERWRDLDLKTKQAFQAELDRMAEKYAKAMDVFRLQCEALGLGEYKTHLEAQLPMDLEKLEESLSQMGTPVLQAATMFISSSIRGSSSRESAAQATSDNGQGGAAVTSPSPLARQMGTPPLKPGENPHARRDGLLAAGAAGVLPMPPFSPLPPMARGSPRLSSSTRSGEPPFQQPKLQRPVSPVSANRQQQPPRPPGVHTPGRSIQHRPASPKQPVMAGGNVFPPIQPARAPSSSSPQLPGPRSLFPQPSTPSTSVATASSHLAFPSPNAAATSLLGSPSSMPASFVLYQASSRFNRFESAGTSPPPAGLSATSAHTASTHTSSPMAAPPPGVIAPGTIPTTSASHHSSSGKPPADGIKTYLNTVVGDRQYQQYVQQRNAAAAAVAVHGSPSTLASSTTAGVRSPAAPTTRGLPPRNR